EKTPSPSPAAEEPLSRSKVVEHGEWQREQGRHRPGPSQPTDTHRLSSALFVLRLSVQLRGAHQPGQPGAVQVIAQACVIVRAASWDRIVRAVARDGGPAAGLHALRVPPGAHGQLHPAVQLHQLPADSRHCADYSQPLT
uniref:Histone H3 n=1 Tax=Macrostomum lignano TaxID=282301 RepID=A0A1I8FQX5_9PLAT